MPISPSLTPARQLPFFSSAVFTKVSTTPIVASVGTGVVQMTAAQLLNGFLVVDCQDAQTLTLPTAAAINAALPGVAVGTAFDFELLNYGDSLLTVALAAGVTKVTVAGVSAILTVATLTMRKFKLVCTNVTPGSEAWQIYATAAATVAA